MTFAEDLGGAWNLRVDPHGDSAASLPGQARALSDVTVPAIVPGCVHVDLMGAGRLADPFLDDNETAVAWVGRTDWVYSRDVAWNGPEHERVDLVFEGLDTVAGIELGGVTLGTTRNMHRTYRYDVTALV